jgi:hypothetical protein
MVDSVHNITSIYCDVMTVTVNDVTATYILCIMGVKTGLRLTLMLSS